MQARGAARRPVCKNIEYEQGKTRAHMLADGYTQRELQQRLHNHHCG
ncbi:MAG TPA: hypothetical protein VFJ87_04010 [Rhodanobacteraceae bacterium]|nr:hypothetical protein [Rhodanobacteraceae bacterium]